jgi:hypothetical protein
MPSRDTPFFDRLQAVFNVIVGVTDTRSLPYAFRRAGPLGNRPGYPAAPGDLAAHAAGAVGARSGCRRLRRGSPGGSPMQQRSRPVPPGLDEQKIRQTGFTGSPCEPDE